MVSKLFSFAVLGALAVTASAQVFYMGNPNIIVPPSTLPQPAGHASTHYLYYVGPDRTHQAISIDNNTFHRGPSAARQGGIPGYHPADVRAAYKIPNSLGTNAIAIVDAFSSGSELADFNAFSSAFALPQEPSTNPTAITNRVFQVVYAQGSQPPVNDGWAGEIALDIEWAHALAPNAKIFLVEAADNSFANLWAAVDTAKQLPRVHEVSMSFGSNEFSGEAANDFHFIQPGVAFFASSGDVGGAQSYPAESPNVVGVGGTSIQISGTGTVTSETAWDGSGGGPSSFATRPPYQSRIAAIVGSSRGCPDIAAIADPNTGAAIYLGGSWDVVGGTSLACPVTAAIANARGQFATSSSDELTRVYRNLGTKFYRDITSGSAGSFTATTGWDFITGVGCPIGLYDPIVTNGNTVYPFAFSIVVGNQSAGNLASFTAVDGNTFDVSTVGTSYAAAAAGYSADFVIPAGTSLSVSGSLTAAAGTLATTQVFAYNWSRNVFEYVRAAPLRGQYGTLVFDLGTGFARYVDSSNKVRILVRSIVPLRKMSPAYKLQTDQLYLSVN